MKVNSAVLNFAESHALENIAHACGRICLRHGESDSVYVTYSIIVISKLKDCLRSAVVKYTVKW